MLMAMEREGVLQGVPQGVPQEEYRAVITTMAPAWQLAPLWLLCLLLAAELL
jgi:hypothetical protein